MESELRLAFYTDVETFAAAQTLDVAHPNVDFDPADVPQATQFYLRTAVLPSRPTVQGVRQGWSEYLWTCQVSVYARQGIGELAPLRHADAIRDAFPVDYALVGDTQTFTVVEPATIAPPVPVGAWFFVPVSIPVHTIK